MVKTLRKYRLGILIGVYFLTRLINLVLLPIFNDEAIYLNWGQRMLHSSGHAFYSLYDGKQPLLMWVFGLANEFVADPLVAGRLVSVILGGLGLWGLYKLSGCVTAPLIYIICPLFVFFDRQALMESAVGCFGIWSLYFLLRFVDQKQYRWVLGLGILGGLGLFIKSNVGIFYLLSVLYLIYLIIKEEKFRDRQRIFWSLILAVFISALILLPLLLQPEAKNIINMGNRFNLTLKELFSLPIGNWWQNLKVLTAISFWHLSAPVLFLGIIGIIDRQKHKLIRFWFLGSLIIAVLTARNLNPRYLMPLLAVLPLFSASGLNCLFRIQKALGYLGLFFLILPLFLTLLLIFKPADYFNLLHRFTPAFSQKEEYVTGNPSGYGMPELRQYLEEKTYNGPIYIGVRLDAGNPENALMAYYFKNPEINVIYFDKQIIGPDVPIDKITFDRPFYFISRSEHKGGLEDYLTEEKRFYKPEGKSYFGVYRFADNKI